MDYASLLDELHISYKEFPAYFSFSSPFRSDSHPSMILYKDNGFVIDFGSRYKSSFERFYQKVSGKELISTTAWSALFLTPQKPVGGLKELRVDVKLEGSAVPVFESKEALTYCYSRGMNDEFIDHFGLLYTEFCRIKGIRQGVPEELDPTTGNPRKGTVFKKRLLVPIVEDGCLVSVEGRDITRTAEKKCIYPRGCSVSTLFNIDELDPTQPVAVTEGIMGLVKIWQSVTKNVTCVFGIQITERQKELLRTRFPKLVLFPDYDDAGFEMIGTFNQFYENEFEVAQVEEFIEDSKSKKDPGDCYPEYLKKVWVSRIPVAEFLLRESGIISNARPLWENE